MAQTHNQLNLSIPHVLSALGPDWVYLRDRARRYQNIRTGEILSRRKALDRAVAANAERFGGATTYEKVSSSRRWHKSKEYKTYRYKDYTPEQYNAVWKDMAKLPGEYMLSVQAQWTEQYIAGEEDSETVSNTIFWRTLTPQTRVTTPDSLYAFRRKFEERLVELKERGALASMEDIITYRVFHRPPSEEVIR